MFRCSVCQCLIFFYIGLFNVQFADVHYANIKPTNAQSADVQSSNVQSPNVESIDVQSGCPDHSLNVLANYCKFYQIVADLRYHFLCGCKLGCPRRQGREK
jgi:hypothetical protein